MTTLTVKHVDALQVGDVVLLEGKRLTVSRRTTRDVYFDNRGWLPADTSIRVQVVTNA